MNKQSIPSLLIIALMIFVFFGCSRQLSQSQLNFGIEAAKKDLWDEAIFRWKKVLSTNPNSAAAHNNLAVAYEKKGLWEEAKKEYLKIGFSPDIKNSKDRRIFRLFEICY